MSAGLPSQQEPSLILVVEDDDLSRRYATLALGRLGYEVMEAPTFAAALASLRHRAPDVILLDVDLPDANGIVAVPHLRELSTAPIIFVSAKVDELNKVMALDAGGDDYVTKPYTIAELSARIRVVLRHSKAAPADLRGQLQAGPVVLDKAAHTVTARGAPVVLTAREFEILQFLVEQSHRVLRRQEIFDAIWGADFSGDTSALDGYILHLRQKLEVDPRHPSLIRTVHGVGFQFTAIE